MNWRPFHLLPQNTVQSWSLAIRQLLDDTVYRTKLAHEAFQFYENHLTWQVVGSQLEKLFMGEGKER
jgi:glycosyltransferase involved in cell wall biosynthesis